MTKRIAQTPTTRLPAQVTTATSSSEASAAHATRVLLVAMFAFTAFFAVWVMFAIVGIPLQKELGLSTSQFATLVAIPVLTGSILRIPMGLVTGIIGGRRTMAGLAIATAIPAFIITHATSYTMLVALAFWLGIAGTSFAVGVPWVSAWTPPARQGGALGLFGLGNVGASITKILAPSLVTLVAAGGLLGGLVPGGWRFVSFVYGVLMLLVAAAVLVLTPKNDPTPGKGRTLISLVRPLAIFRVWRFGYYYMVVFGAYMALTLWLPHYYVDVYGETLAKAGLLTALFIFPASLVRPIGGMLSDRFGARPVTMLALISIVATCGWLATGVSLMPFVVLVFAAGLGMGIGMGGVYAYIPQYFPRDVGTVGGLVGAVGGVGGFILPQLFARMQDATGAPHSTFGVIAAFAAVSIIVLVVAIASIGPDVRYGDK